MGTIAIFGAGSIGCYLGGHLFAAGYDTLLIGRPRIGLAIAEHGLTLTDWKEKRISVLPAAVRFDTDLGRLAEADIVLVTVKSTASVAAARELAEKTRPGCPIVSLQNGVRNHEMLCQELPHRTVLRGTVTFNVVNRGPGWFHRGTNGRLILERHPATLRLVSVFRTAGVGASLSRDAEGVQWTKLIINLNNAINALAGLPLQVELLQPAYRCALALAMQEAIATCRLARVRLARVAPVPTRMVPFLLRLPDPVFKMVARSMLDVDATARSSMWEDLQLGRSTEIDWINGEIVRLAERCGCAAPINAKLVSLIHDAEAGNATPLDGQALLASLRAARM